MAIQRDEAWLKTASVEEIMAADAGGELDELQGRVVHSYPEIASIPHLQRDQAWVDAAPPRLVAAAYEAGELDELLGRIPAHEVVEKPAWGLYGDGTIRVHEPTPRGDLPQEVGPAVDLGVGTAPNAFGVVPAIPRGRN